MTGCPVGGCVQYRGGEEMEEAAGMGDSASVDQVEEGSLWIP